MLLLCLSYIFIGVISGTLSGLLGIGGGVVVVPLLVFTLRTHGHIPADHLVQVAAASSLAIMIATSLRSIYVRWRKGLVDFEILKPLLPGVIIGVVLGAAFASHIPSHILEVILGLGLVAIALYLLFGANPALGEAKRNPLRDLAAATFVGLSSGMLGLGGGVVLIPYLLYCSIDLRKASSAAAACSLPIAIVGTISYALLGIHLHISAPYSLGFIYWPAVVVIATASVLSVSLGVHLSLRMNALWLKRVFALFLLLIAIYMLLS